MDRVAEDFWREIMDWNYHLSRKGYAVLSGLKACPFARSNGQIYRCRYVAWAFGMLRDPTDTVHHRDRDKLNDHPSNLEVLTRSEHSYLHTTILMSEEHKKKIAASLKGHFVSEATKRRLSESHKGIRLSEEAKEKVSLAMKGRIITWGDKLSVALKGRRPSEKCEAARLDAIRGKPLSEEHKARLSEKSRIAMKRIWAERKASRG